MENMENVLTIEDTAVSCQLLKGSGDGGALKARLSHPPLEDAQTSETHLRTITAAV